MNIITLNLFILKKILKLNKVIINYIFIKSKKYIVLIEYK